MTAFRACRDYGKCTLMICDYSTVLHRFNPPSTRAMRDDVECEIPAEYEGAAILKRIGAVLDPGTGRVDP